MRSISSLIRDKTRSEIVRPRTQAAALVYLLIWLTTIYRSVLAACPAYIGGVVAGKPLAIRLHMLHKVSQKITHSSIQIPQLFMTDVNVFSSFMVLMNDSDVDLSSSLYWQPWAMMDYFCWHFAGKHSRIKRKLTMVIGWKHDRKT